MQVLSLTKCHRTILIFHGPRAGHIVILPSEHSVITKILSGHGACPPSPWPLSFTEIMVGGGVFLITKVVDVPKKGSFIYITKRGSSKSNF